MDCGFVRGRKIIRNWQNGKGGAETEAGVWQMMEEAAAKDRIEPGNPEFIRRRDAIREALGGDRKGEYSIRINDQWRICFKWPNRAPGPKEVKIEDYH